MDPMSVVAAQVVRGVSGDARSALPHAPVVITAERNVPGAVSRSRRACRWPASAGRDRLAAADERLRALNAGDLATHNRWATRG
jgi:hypothetical protein